MVRNNTISRIERLEILKARLKSGEATIIGDIAEELGISIRTVSRDIQLLREQGLHIDADRGRGGGVRLERHWGIGRVNFNYNEAIDLMISLAVTERMNSPLFMANLQSARRKIMASFSPSMSFLVKGMKARILIGGGASANMIANYQSPDPINVKNIHQAFLTRNRLEIDYLSINEIETHRTIEPHYLLLCSPVWYMVTWDELRQDVRTFRCDRLISCKILDDEFKLLPVRNFSKAFEGFEII